MKFGNILQILRHLQFFAEISRKLLHNAYSLAKIGADTAENEQHFAEILPKTGNYHTGPQKCSESRRGTQRPPFAVRVKFRLPLS